MMRGVTSPAPEAPQMLLKETALLRLVGLRIPMFLFLGPRVLELDDERCAVEIPLNWRTKNHLIGSMYFGTLCAGADLAGGLPAARLMMTKHRDVRLVFGEMHAEFLKRADGDVVFRSKDPRRVAELVREAARTGERVSAKVEVVATVPSRYGDEPVARFTMTISMKRKAAKVREAAGAQGRAEPQAGSRAARTRDPAAVDAP
jgi:acyl-coenzyme A thioesterase PaaI-like protein